MREKVEKLKSEEALCFSNVSLNQRLRSHLVERRDQKLHAPVARSTLPSQNV